jgi:hypothetical protein
MGVLTQRPKWPGLRREKSRHGKTCWYVSSDSGERVHLKSNPEDKLAIRAEYEEAYAALLKGEKPSRAHAKGARPAANTLAWLWEQYTSSVK